MNFLRRRRPSEDDDEDILNGPSTSSKTHKSRKPPNTAFRQQRLKAWQPILTPLLVIPFLFLLALIFAPLGIAIIYTTYNTQILSLDYSKCDKLATDLFENVPSKYTRYHFKLNNADPKFQWRYSNDTNRRGTGPTCEVQFTVPVDIKPPIFLYYRLTNFFQNHRKYVSSFDLGQLRGNAVLIDSLSDDCKPLLHREVDGEKKIIYPCGLIANSLFNDTFSSPVLLNSRSLNDNETFQMSHKDISWSLDRNGKYKKTQYNASQIVPPPNWESSFPDGYNDDNIPDLATWEHFQNWMRTSGLPSFYKLYSRNTTAPLSSGTYELSIGLNYPVEVFGGSKSLVITTNNTFGGRNMSLGIIYIVVAVISLVLAIAFLIQHLFKPRRIGDHNYLQSGGDVVPSNIRDQL